MTKQAPMARTFPFAGDGAHDATVCIVQGPNNNGLCVVANVGALSVRFVRHRDQLTPLNDEATALLAPPKCGKCFREERADPPESCPYSADVGNNPNDLCTCCDTCRAECAEDI